MRIKMERQVSESKDIVWFFPKIGDGYIEPHNATAFFTVFYKTYEQAYIASIQNNTKFITKIDQMFEAMHEDSSYFDVGLVTEIVYTAMNLYKDEVAFRGKFEYVLLGNRFMLKVADFIKYGDRAEINRFQESYKRGD